MRTTSLVLAVSLAASGGCYLGATPSAKHTARVVNGTFLGAGGSFVFGGLVSGGWDGVALALAGAPLIVMGAVGFLMDATVDEKPVPWPLARPGSTPVRARVTGPGLQPATITLE